MSAVPRPNLIALALLAGGGVMVLELAAPRLVAPHLGTTALTWTVVIATFLGGIAVGNGIGGRVADRSHPSTLPQLFVLAGIASAAALPLHALAGWATLSLPHTWRVLLAVPIAFFPAAVVLGTLPPVLARELLRHAERPGLWLGLVSATSALGSVGGTLLAGFVLVPALGTRWIFLVVAGALAVGSLLARTGAARPVEHESPPAERVRAILPRGWAALAVLAGAAILTVEIIAGRVVGEAVGASIYTWTSVIGVVLLGIALGNAAGGKLADRYAARPLLAALLLGSSIAVCLVLWGVPIADYAETLADHDEHDVPWSLAILTMTAAAFLLPAFVLGTLSPVVIRAALAGPETDGRVVGSLYAAGTWGAVAAAVLSGYVLIPWLGRERLLLVVAFALAAASGLVRGRQPYVWLGILALLAVSLNANFQPLRGWAEAISLRDDAETVHETDSRYSRIRVMPVHRRWVRLEAAPSMDRVYAHEVLGKHMKWKPGRGRLWWNSREQMTVLQRAWLQQAMQTEADREAAERLRALTDRTRHVQRLLRLDRLVHGYVDVKDPTWLGYVYERIYAAVIRRAWPREGQVRCLFLGGGAYAFQRRLLATEGDRLEAVTAEIDPEVTNTARQHLGLEVDPRHRIVHEDARTYVARLPEAEGGFRFVFGDAFNDLAVPFHLTTVEFTRALKARMPWDGVYLVNVIDTFDSGRFLGAFLCTLETVFDHVYVLAAKPRQDHWRDTFVVAASNRPISLDDLRDDDGHPLGVVRYDLADVEMLRRSANHLVLTDDHAPVETLLAPVVAERVP